MQGILNVINAWTLAFYLGAKQRVTNEVSRLKENESGMEVVQVVIILLIVIVIAAAMWTFLKPWVESLLGTTEQTAGSMDFNVVPSP